MHYRNVQAYSLPQHQLAWQQIQPAEHLGQDCSTYKWSQSQTEVDVYVQIPTQIRRHEVICLSLLFVMHNSALLSSALLLIFAAPSMPGMVLGVPCQFTNVLF
jgi:hypothetical protein